MDRKAKWIATFCVVLLLGLAFGSSVSFDVDVASGSALPWYPGFPDIVTGTENVTWDFYVVAAYNTTSPPITPAPQPSGFNFTVVDGGQTMGHSGTGPGPVPGGFDYGRLEEYAGRDYLSGWGWVEINITNNLGVDVVVTNLTAEVTNGTMTEEWLHVDILRNCIWPIEDCEKIARIGNFTFVNFQYFDPYMDEVDYYAGTAYPMYDSTAFHDTRVMDLGQMNNYTMMPWGPATLLGPDRDGDAAATGHVAPVLLRAGETFNEFFGPGIFGNATVPTKIRGTITLTLVYRRLVTPGSVDVLDVSFFYVFLYRVFIINEAYITWIVQVNVTVRNTGATAIDMNVSLWGLTATCGNLTHWTGGTLEQMGTFQTVTDLAPGANTTLTFSWDLSNAPTGLVPARVIAVAAHNSTYSHYDELWSQIAIIPWGDVNNNGIFDLGDIGKIILCYSGIITDPEVCRYSDLNGNGVVDLGDIGKIILIYSGIIGPPGCP